MPSHRLTTVRLAGGTWEHQYLQLGKVGQKKTNIIRITVSSMQNSPGIQREKEREAVSREKMVPTKKRS